MAHRDRSQGFGFIYVDIEDVLAQRNEIAKADQQNMHVAPSKEIQRISLNRDPRSTESQTIPTPATPPPQERQQAISQIRENLDRLQSLHHKLHAMLEELNKVTGKKR